MGAIVGGLVLFIAIFVGGYIWTSYDRVDPGNIGILVDYGDGSIEPITETKWMWVGRYQKLIEWNAGQQVYVMDVGGSSGQLEGDDAVECLTMDTQNIKVDTQTDWRIDPKQIVETYVLWKDTPLTGPGNRKAPSNSLEDHIIRNETRSAVRKVCSEFGWSDILGVKQVEFQDKIDKEVKENASSKGVIINQVTIRQRYPSQALGALMAARLQGQQQQEQSLFLAAQNERQQKIDQAAAVAAGEKSRIEAEAKAKVDVANASAAAQVKRVAAEQEAEAIRSRGLAEADSLKAQAAAVTPSLVDLEKARKWNGQGPTTVLGSEPQIINQIPR